MNRKKKALKYVLTAVLLIVFIHIISCVYVESNNFEVTRNWTYPLMSVIMFPVLGFLLGIILYTMNILMDSRKIDFIGSFTNFKFSPLFIFALIMFAISLVPHHIYFVEFKLFKGGIFKRIFLGPLQHQIVHFVISTIAGFIIAKVSTKFQDYS